MNFKQSILDKALRNVINQAILFEDEFEASRRLKAINKAFDNILHNPTLTFDGVKITFTSLESGKHREVTKFGCTRECDCLGMTSYHSETFNLVNEYQSLSGDEIGDAIYLKESSDKPTERVGEFRI